MESASKEYGRCQNKSAEVRQALKRGFVQSAHFPATGRHGMSQPRFSIRSDALCRWLESLSEAPGYRALARYRGLPSNKGAAVRRLTARSLRYRSGRSPSSAAERQRYPLKSNQIKHQRRKSSNAVPGKKQHWLFGVVLGSPQGL